MAKLSPQEDAAVRRLISIAKGDTGQSKTVAGFLLAWWNAQECGAFSLTDVWGVDSAIADDMVTVFRLLTRHQNYPDTLGYGPEFEALVSLWRPALVTVA